MDYRDELAATALKIMAPGKGILAADEGPASVKKKFDSIGI
jgi:fructose-bisphosphate aldolase class 1